MEALAVDELHDDVVVAGVAEVVDDAHDARVVELGQQPRLDLEARDVRRVEEALDGDEAPGLVVERAVDRAHRAARRWRPGPCNGRPPRLPDRGSPRSEHSCRVARTMEWFEVFAVFLVSHLVGDYLLQTDWQAVHKHRGLGPDPVSRRALASHVATYTLAFVPALIWLGGEPQPRRRHRRARPASPSRTSSRTTAACSPSTSAASRAATSPPSRWWAPRSTRRCTSSPSSGSRCWPRAERGATARSVRVLPCAAAIATRVAAGRIGGEMSAVGELVQGERRGRWLVARSRAWRRWRGRPRRRARPTTRSPARR